MPRQVNNVDVARPHDVIMREQASDIELNLRRQMERTALFEAIDLHKSWGGRPVVRGLSVKLYPGEVLGLLGPNGAGKSTAFYMTIGLVRPDRGRCLWLGEDITDRAIHQRANLGMGYLAQEPSIFRQLTVFENLQLVLERLNISKEERHVRISEQLRDLRLDAVAQQRAATLSGGQRRRLEIARALVLSPKLLLLDEPFANVDPMTIAEVKTMIRYLSTKGIAVLITDHNAREILSIVHRAQLLVDGICIAEGSPEQLIADSTVRERYLGSEF